MIWRPYKNLIFSSTLVIVFVLSVFVSLQLLKYLCFDAGSKLVLKGPSHWKTVVIPDGAFQSKPTDSKCNYFSCFNVYQCGRSGRQHISVYVYPLAHYVDQEHVEIMPISQEFYQLLEAIINSKFSVSDPEDACIFLPSIDTLNENNLRVGKISQILAQLPYWNNGVNHLLFNFLPGTTPDFHTSLGVDRGKAMIAGGGFSSLSYRRTFDVSVPVYNPLHQDAVLFLHPVDKRRWLLVSAQVNLHREYRQELEEQLYTLTSPDDLLILSKCDQRPLNLTIRCRGNTVVNYPEVLTEAKFCLVMRGGRLGQAALYDAMRAGCIPVIAINTYVMPFSEEIDWSQASIQIYEEELIDVISILKTKVSHQRMLEMQKQVIWLYERYFATIKDIALTTLDIINNRVFPVHSLTKEEWNSRPIQGAIKNPLFLPLITPQRDGFTAVILTYDRVDSLFQVIQTISHVPSITHILVIWNNQKKVPPLASTWPKVDVPVKVIQAQENKLSNRFYPYDDIQTECVLSIDDDINMMTTDELEFGYQVWREFPDRIVGFPSRNVVWNNDTNSWKYDSEWTNEVSMVLTGIAFLHKYWFYVYTARMPGSIKEWVDQHMNCEDIAMNFLVANMTGKAPIKVTPRKKFKCRECMSGELSANEAHMVERSHCVNHFAKVFGTMPLKTVEFRADPVLYMDDFPEKLKLYSNMGSL